MHGQSSNKQGTYIPSKVSTVQGKNQDKQEQNKPKDRDGKGRGKRDGAWQAGQEHSTSWQSPVRAGDVRSSHCWLLLLLLLHIRVALSSSPPLHSRNETENPTQALQPAQVEVHFTAYRIGASCMYRYGAPHGLARYDWA